MLMCCSDPGDGEEKWPKKNLVKKQVERLTEWRIMTVFVTY